MTDAAVPPGLSAESNAILDRLHRAGGGLANTRGYASPEFDESVSAMGEAKRHVAKLEAECAAIEKLYTAMCARLQDCVQKHHIGLGGEHVDDLVIEEIDQLVAERDAALDRAKELEQRERGHHFRAELEDGGAL